MGALVIPVSRKMEFSLAALILVMTLFSTVNHCEATSSSVYGFTNGTTTNSSQCNECLIGQDEDLEFLMDSTSSSLAEPFRFNHLTTTTSVPNYPAAGCDRKLNGQTYSGCPPLENSNVKIGEHCKYTYKDNRNRLCVKM